MIRRLFACPECDNRLTRTQTVLGWCYLPMHFFVVPTLASLYVVYAPGAYSGVDVNKIYFGVGIVFVLIVMGEWLRRNFYVLLEHPGRFALCLAIGFAADYLLSIIVQLALLLIQGVEENPNNQELARMSGDDFGAMLGITVFLAPMVEEPLFRGVVFGSIRGKSRAAAYAVSVLLFSLLHVWQYVLIYADAWYFIYMLQYLPVSFVLAWLYERSGTIWTPIAFHMLFNGMSFYLMSVL